MEKDILKYKNDFLGVPVWLSQLSVWLLVLAQVMIPQFMSSSPASGSVLTALELAWDSLSSLCSSSAYAWAHTLSLK